MSDFDTVIAQNGLEPAMRIRRVRGHATSRARRADARWWSVPLLAVVVLSLVVSVEVSVPGTNTGSSSSGARGASSGADRPTPSGGGTLTLNDPGLNVTDTASSFSWISPEYYACGYGYCYNDSADPSLVQLPNGDVGLGYDISTNQTTNSCTDGGGPAGVTWQVAWATSSNGGASFGSPTLIDNQTCPFIDALQPGFAASGPNVYGVFVEANFTAYDGLAEGYFALENYLMDPTNDTLGFVTITNDGTVVSPISTIAQVGNGGIGRPVIAAFGQSVYIVYAQVDNTTVLPSLGLGCEGICYPMTLEFLNSSNGGVTWTGPRPLPSSESNPSWDNTSLGASIAVNGTGTVAVSYATNLTCAAWCLNGIPEIASDIVTVFSTDNGSAWSESLISPAAAQRSYISYYYDLQIAVDLTLDPQTSIAWSAANNTWAVGWAAGYNATTRFGPVVCNELIVLCYGAASGVWVAISEDAGASWSISNLTTPGYTEATDCGLCTYASNSNIGVNVTSSGVVLSSFTFFNFSVYGYGTELPCVVGPALPTAPIEVQYVATTADQGGAWRTDQVASSVYPPEIQYFGISSAVLALTSGTSVSAYVLAGNSYVVNTAALAVATLAAPTSTTDVTLKVAGLPASTTWDATVSGPGLSTLVIQTADSTVQLDGVPTGTPVTTIPSTVGPTGWKEYQGSVTPDPLPAAGAGPVQYVNYTVYWGLGINLDVPTLPAGQEIYLATSGGYLGVNWSYFYELGFPANPLEDCPYPWFLPAGQSFAISTGPATTSYEIQLTPGFFNVSYWQGNGPGNYTGLATDAVFSLTGPVNETGWIGSWGTNFSTTFVPQGLPGGSTYEFDVNGGTYSALGSQNVTVSPLATGAYAVTHIQATSTTPGWEYFGSSTVGNPIAVPYDPQVGLNFSALVNVSASPSAVTFHAEGLGAGTPWQLGINGTTYNATGPSLTVALKPGTYPIAEYPAIALNDSEAYLPLSATTSLSVAAGGVYPIDFDLAEKVTAAASFGGTVTDGGTHWIAPGGSASFEAVPDAGYTFAGWEGTGTGSYTGTDLWANVTQVGSAPITETATFYGAPADRFFLNFSETGIPAGIWWTVDVNGRGYSSNSAVLSVPKVDSCSTSYVISVPTAYDGTNGTRYVAVNPPPTACSSGTVPLTFQAQYHLAVSGSPNGAVSVAVNSTTVPDQTWLAAGTLAVLRAETDSGYYFAGWNGSGLGSYTGPDSLASTTPGGPVTEVANFQPVVHPLPTRYVISVEETAAFSPGTSWGVELNGSTYAATGPWLNVSGFLPGTYPVTVLNAIAPDDLTEYIPVSAPTSVTVATSSPAVRIAYQTDYWLAVSAVGQGTVGPGSAFLPSGSTVSLSAIPTGGQVFQGWTGTGPGAYSGANPNGSFVLTGPVTEVASFTAPAPAASSSAGASPFASAAAWAGFAAIGLVAGIVLALVFVRRRRRDESEPPRSDAGAGPP